MPQTPDSSLTNFFHLPALKILKFSPKYGFSICETKSTSADCSRCHTTSHSIYDHRTIVIKDTPLKLGIRPLILHIKKKRFFCCQCLRPFTENIPGIQKGSRTTEKFKYMVMWACERFSSLSQVSKDFCVSSDYVYESFYEQLELKRRKDNQYDWPEKIGIDEHGFGRDKVAKKKVFVSMIVNQSRKKLMEVVFGKSQRDLETRLDHIKGKENVKFVTMDMCDPYRNFSKSFFPQAEIVADKFHVIRLLTPHLIKERKLITGSNMDRKTKSLLLCNSSRLSYFDLIDLRNFLRPHHKLSSLYEAKERLHQFYRIKGFDRAKIAMEKLISRYKDSPYQEIIKLGYTLQRWKIEVLNYFKTGLTNARLEGFNNKASLVRRRAFGYKNPNNYRLRVLSVCS